MRSGNGLLTGVAVIRSIYGAITHTVIPLIPLILLALILGLPGVLIVVTAHRVSYVAWMAIYLLSLPIWNFVLPTYAYWHFDDFSWGDTRQTAGEKKGSGKGGHEDGGEFDSSKITMKRWVDFEQERRLRGAGWSATGYGSGGVSSASPTHGVPSVVGGAEGYARGGAQHGHVRKGSNLGYSVTEYHDYP